jgi:hypothetical protein
MSDQEMMKYVSCDLETTCLNPRQPDRILAVSMVVEDVAKADIPVHELPHFTCLVDQGRYEGEPYALQMNAWILKMLAEPKKYHDNPYPIYKPKDWINLCLQFLDKHFDPDGRIVMSGKNAAGFDMRFLPEKIKRRFRCRVIDPGSVFIDWSQEAPMGQQQIMDKLEIKGEVTHNMHQDACDNITMNRHSYGRSFWDR